MEEAAWWKGYFDEDFARLYRPHLPPEESRAEAEAVAELLGLEPGDRVLDLACGWGRHAVELARMGFRVAGLDASAVLLDDARAAAAAAGVEVEWVHGDVRTLPWEGEFDAVISMFSSFGYFLDDAEDLRALRAACAALRPSGALLVETMHRDAVVREYAERDWWEGEAGEHVWVERAFDAVAGVSHETLRWRFDDGRAGEKEHAIRVRTATEWGDLLERAGLEPVGWYGGWELSELDHRAERLIVVARPAGRA